MGQEEERRVREKDWRTHRSSIEACARFVAHWGKEVNFQL